MAGMDVQALLREITSERGYRDQIVHVREVPARQAAHASPQAEIPEPIASLLRRQNIHRLYSHQATAIDAIAAKQDVVIVTGTASGKTLCYNVPVVAELLARPQSRAMYVFPTKALAQDQFGLLQRWAREDEQISEVLAPAVYDGDTPSHNRAKIRSAASVVLTNPDMLHVGILPYHAKWHEFLRELRYIVLDEVHTYRGIFGSHVAGVVRRLLRMCEHYGSVPQIVCCSATIANPLELTGQLTGRELTLIDNDGAPRGRKYFVLWNPPFIDVGEKVSRRSANVEAVDLLAELVRRRAQTIVFAKARVVAELVYKYARDALAGEGDLAERIRPYRGGYLPSERRQIEQELFAGRLLAVSATNALELGIDVGSLDAAILVGFPGTICSTWQQAGRAGRTASDSLVVLVAYNDPVDQFLMRHPEYFFGASHEHAVIDPANPYVLTGQLSCACFEKPLTGDDARHFGPLATEVADMVAADGEMKLIDDHYYWASSAHPSAQVGLRNTSQNNYAIVDTTAGHKTIGQVDAISAPELVYPEAVYLHEGESYLVRELDTEAHIAHVEPCQVDYYTQAVLASQCRITNTRAEQPYVDGRSYFGDLDVTWQTTAFRKIKYYTMELVGQAAVDLPPQTLATTAMWWTVSEAMRNALAAAGYNPVEGLMGTRNLMLVTLPALAMCDRRDISGVVDSSNLGVHTIFVYDRYPGGVGFAQKGRQLMDDWLDMCRAIVAECPCEAGCPSCVAPPNLRPPIHSDPDLYGGFSVPNKAATALLLELLERQSRRGHTEPTENNA